MIFSNFNWNHIVTLVCINMGILDSVSKLGLPSVLRNLLAKLRMEGIRRIMGLVGNIIRIRIKIKISNKKKVRAKMMMAMVGKMDRIC